jgi:3-oxoacyl-[acyl-carrier protein] reductase
MAEAVLPYLNPCGRVINIGSLGARAGFRGLGLYCASKVSLEGLTRCWAAELGANGTTVNTVACGPVHSDMLNNIPK